MATDEGYCQRFLYQQSVYDQFCIVLLQIRLYMAETFHRAYGIMRTMLKDSTNMDHTNSYMDSDGRVAAYFDNQTRLPGYERHFLGDGLWHMATLTTLSHDPHGMQGHAMYLDGVMVAMQEADQLYTGELSHSNTLR